jgi:hypothetical protein
VAASPPDTITLDQFLHFCLEDPPIVRFVTMIEKLDVARECMRARLGPTTHAARGACYC